MRTSKQDRLREFEDLEWRNQAGRLLAIEDVKRYSQLRREFLPTPAKENLKPLKASDNQ